MVVPDADVLQHAHRDERVAGAFDVAIIVVDELHHGVHSLSRRTFAGVRDLLARDVEGSDPDAEFARHVQGQGAPPAAGLDDPLTRPEHQLAADVVHLGPLRLLQRGLGRVVVRAGVDHLLVEPQPVEVVAQVVVVLDMPPRSARGVGARLGQSAQGAALGRDRVRAIRRSITAREHVDEIALDLDAPCAERISESDLRTEDHREKRAAVAKDDASVALARRTVRVLPVPERKRHIRLTHLCRDPPHEPAIEIARARARSPGWPVLGHSRAEDAGQTEWMRALSSHRHLPPPVTKPPTNRRIRSMDTGSSAVKHSVRVRVRYGRAPRSSSPSRKL